MFSGEKDDPLPKDALDSLAAKKKLGVLEENPPGPLGELEARGIDHAEIKRSAVRTATGDVDPNSEEARTDNGPKAPPRTVAGFEAKWAAGHTKIAGKHIAADGLVSKGGYRRILPDYKDAGDEVWDEIRRKQLEEIAGEVLSGRTATVFDALVLAPLRGKQGRTVEDLANQFGVTTDRIHKIKHDATRKIEDGLMKPKNYETTADPAALPTQPIAEWRAQVAGYRAHVASLERKNPDFDDRWKSALAKYRRERRKNKSNFEGEIGHIPPHR